LDINSSRCKREWAFRGAANLGHLGTHASIHGTGRKKAAYVGRPAVAASRRFTATNPFPFPRSTSPRRQDETFFGSAAPPPERRQLPWPPFLLQLRVRGTLPPLLYHLQFSTPLLLYQWWEVKRSSDGKGLFQRRLARTAWGGWAAMAAEGLVRTHTNERTANARREAARGQARPSYIRGARGAAKTRNSYAAHTRYTAQQVRQIRRGCGLLRSVPLAP
jgi:hypothetical protein